jgi:hypothetical protein
MGFFSALAKKVFLWKNVVKTKEEIDEFFKDVTYPFGLKNKLSELGFAPKGAWSSWFDWAKELEEILVSKLLTCSDYLNLYTALYKKLGVKFETFLLETEGLFPCRHYVSVFEWTNKAGEPVGFLLQTFNDMHRLAYKSEQEVFKAEEAVLKFFAGKFTKITKIQ